MINIDLSWQQAAASTGCLAAVAAVLLRRSRVVALGQRPADGPPARDDPPGAAAAQRARHAVTAARLAAAGGFVREAALVFALFALWQFAGSFSVMGPDGALGRARWLWHTERVLRLPSETGLQRLVLPHPLIVQVCDLYYDILHFPVLLGCLVWLFARHRERYSRFRNTLVAFTGLCLLIQLIPVAPPRMLPGIGMVDTAAVYGQSVYSATRGCDADQLSAMPSVHVGWAILVAVAVVGARSRWRWLAVAYPIATSYAVVVTANHFWLDGLAAGAVLVAVLAAQAAARRLLAAHAGRAVPGGALSPAGETVPAGQSGIRAGTSSDLVGS